MNQALTQVIPGLGGRRSGQQGIQTYVLTMLVSMYYGEVSEPGAPKKAKAAHAAQT